MNPNSSFRDTGDSPTILHYFQQHQYPFCKKTHSLASLRSGIAIAEILTNKLPQPYHPLFLPNIEIYNLSPQRAILNLKVILNTLRSYYGQHPQLGVSMEDFSGEGLYFDHNMMETFIFTAIMPLQVQESEGPTDQVLREAYLGVQEISDIANLSSIMANNESKPAENQLPLARLSQKSIHRATILDKGTLKIQKIWDWLQEAHHIDATDLSPEQIIGQLVNSIFAGSRLDNQKIIKQCHYELGSVTVFKKVCEYLLECERMPKQKVLTLLEQVEEGCIRQELFWGVIQDMMNIRASHTLKMARKNSSKSTQRQRKHTSADKENLLNVNILPPTKLSPIKQKQTQAYQISKQTIKRAEQWISRDLGYQHSLSKSRSASKIQDNPLLNGILLGSIVMRMQLGKVSINKQPKKKSDIDKNMSQVLSCIIRRGIEAGRKFSHFKPDYITYLGIIWQVREQWQHKLTLQKTKRAELTRQRRDLFKQINLEEKQIISQWLRSRNIQLKSLQYLPAGIVSEVCGQILQLRLFRQTTKRIKETNMTKILQQLRRLGWQQEGSTIQALSDQGSNLRWNMLRFARELVKHKVYYYR